MIAISSYYKSVVWVSHGVNGITQYLILQSDVKERRGSARKGDVMRIPVSVHVDSP